MKQSRFSAATCTKKHKKFPLCGIYFNAVEHWSLPERFVEVVDREGHQLPLNRALSKTHHEEFTCYKEN